MTKALVDSLQRAVYQTPASPVPVTPPPSVPSPQAAPLDPDAYITGKDAMALAERYAREAAIPAQQATENAASAVYGLGSLRHPKEFGKYTPEIQAYLARVPKTNWTLDTIDLAVKLVKADHMADYRSEWEQEYVSTLEPAMRSIGNAGPGPVSPEAKTQSLESEKIPADWKEKAKKAGLTEAALDEFCRANDMSREAFFKLFDSGKVITELT